MENNLPVGWESAKLSHIVEYKKGKKPKRLESEPFQDSLTYLDIRAIEKNVNEIFADPGSSTITDTNEVVIVWDGARAGWVGLSRVGAVGSTLMALRPKIDKLFLYRFLQSQFDYLHSNHRGTGIPHVDPDILWNIDVPIPPLEEQDRIVAKLNSLFEKIETNKKRLEKIPQVLKRFRQSVLADAVSGRLTEDWRKQFPDSNVNSFNNGIGELEHRNLEFPSSWKCVYTKKCGDHILGKMLDKAKNKGESTLYLRNVNVRWFGFDLNSIFEIKASAIEKQKFEIRNGDLLICEGGEPGRAAVWQGGKTEIIFQKAIHRIRFTDEVSPFWYLFNLKFDADNGTLEGFFTGTGIKHLTLQSLKGYPIPLPPINEQKVIVKRVEELFSYADKIESRYLKAKAQFDKLHQSILAKAFRGELVPQDPEDEPANLLLERILTEKGSKM